MSWLKGLHIAALSLWCASLFYLPALLLDVRRARNAAALKRARIMTRGTYVLVASPAAVIAIFSGTVLAVVAGAGGLWLPLKLTFVTLMVIFHLQCGRLITSLDYLNRLRSSLAIISLFVYPAILIPIVLWLVMGKPF